MCDGRNPRRHEGKISLLVLCAQKREKKRKEKFA
jgi:hypothetical protein